MNKQHLHAEDIVKQTLILHPDWNERGIYEEVYAGMDATGKTKNYEYETGVRLSDGTLEIITSKK